MSVIVVKVGGAVAESTASQLLDLATQCCKVVFQPDAGVVRADRALAAFGSGLEIRAGTKVLSLVPGGVETDKGTIEADAVVVAAGAWASQLVPGLPVTPTRETVSYFELADERPVPSVIDYVNREIYALTGGPGRLKVGVHRTGPATDPDEPGAPDPEIVGFASDWAARMFELARPEPVAVETCIYTNTVDARFVIERHGPVVICSACSGHGFKFATAVGKRVAELVVG